VKTKLISLLILIMILSACSSAAPTATTVGSSYVSSILDTSYTGAMPARNQLSLGTLELAGSDLAITPAQAKTLLPLWQVLLSTQKSGTAAEAEVNAILKSIEDSLTQDQLQAIKAMQLLQTDLQTWASANGVALGTGAGQGQGQGMSPEARATRQAEEGRTPANAGGGASTALLTAVIEYLEQLAP
jgi:hypothetical protein